MRERIPVTGDQGNILGREDATPPSLATPQTDIKAAVNANALPLVDYDLIHVPAEAEAREALLANISVDERGVAHCSGERGTQTLLVAVRIDDEQNASVVPLVQTEEGTLQLQLPSDRPSRIGFFVGFSADTTLSAVLRNGLYPGIPLTTQSRDDSRTGEVMYGLGGIKPDEVDQRRWGEQIDLEGFGFNPNSSRGLFNKNHRPNPTSNTWQESPLVILPDDQADMLPGFDRARVRTNEFQVLLYETQDVKPQPAFNPSDFLGYRGGRETLSFGGALRGLGGQTRGLGLNFGNAVNREAQTTGIKVNSLQGAFRIVAVPAQTSKE